MLNAGGLEICVEIENRACVFRRIGSDRIMPGPAQKPIDLQPFFLLESIALSKVISVTVLLLEWADFIPPLFQGPLMSSEAQIAANRHNAQLSTGPSSDAGKAAVRFNAHKHGVYAQSFIIPGEDPAELEELSARYHRQFQPADPVEEELVDTLIQSAWRRRRLARIEAELFNHLLQEDADSENPSAHPLGAVYARHPEIDKVMRHREAAVRAWDRALRTLLRRRKEVSQALMPAGSTLVSSGPVETKIGFVPKISAPAPQTSPRRDPPWLKRPKTARPDPSKLPPGPENAS